MATLWEILTKKKDPPVPQELQINNPLKMLVGNSIISIDSPNLSGLRFVAKGIREIGRKVDRQTHSFVDYDLIGRDLQSETTEIRLRLVPLENPDGNLTHSSVLLSLYDQFKWNEGFYSTLNNVEKNSPDDPDLRCDDDGSEWWRVNDATTPWEATSLFLEDLDHNGKIDINEVQHEQIVYWDFWRQIENESLEFLMVEMDENHFFQIWRGKEIDPNRIEVAQ